ncbi:MAG: hypothetical protein ACK5AW_22985, partial [Pseudanabaena sp.]
SLMGKIDTNGGLISSTSLAGGNAGAITLNSAKDIKVGDIFARSRDGEIASTGVWNGGKVTLEADGNIETGNITTTSITGNAGKVTLEAGGDIEAGNITTTSITGNAGKVTIKAISRIKVGNVDTFASNNGDAGDVTLLADDDIETLAINANVKGDGAGKGIGGTVKLVSKMGDILTDYVRTDSAGSIGGNITLDAGAALLSAAGIGGTVRAINSFSFAGQDFSLYAGMREGSTINVKYREASFAIGDASTNGTKGSVMSSASLVADWKIDNKFKLASQTKKIELSFESYINNFTALENRVNALVNISYQTEYLSNIVKTIFQPVYSAITYFYGLLGGTPPVELKDIFTGYVNDVKTLQKAKTLTTVAALQDSEFKSNELNAARLVLPDIARLLTSAKKFSVTDNAQIAYILATVSHEVKFGHRETLQLPSTDGNNGLYEYAKTPSGYYDPSAPLRSKNEFKYFQGEYGNNRGNLIPPTDAGEVLKVNGIALAGYAFRGRGYVQITYRNNYDKFGKDPNFNRNFLTITPVDNQPPEKWIYAADIVSTDRVLAADIAVYGMKTDLFVRAYPSSSIFGGFLENISLQNRDDALAKFTDARRIVNAQVQASEIANNAWIYFEALNN